MDFERAEKEFLQAKEDKKCSSCKKVASVLIMDEYFCDYCIDKEFDEEE